MPPDETPKVPVAAVAPIVEDITTKYADLKRNVYDYILSLPKDDPAWASPYLPTLAEQVGLTKS
jgi:hypothetical protein